MVHLAVKTKGDNSIPLKQELPEGVYGIVLQDPHVAKAKLPESHLPTM
ncbi:MAG: hypothetical protein WBZ33_15505 [Thermoactinomyces sp.]